MTGVETYFWARSRKRTLALGCDRQAPLCSSSLFHLLTSYNVLPFFPADIGSNQQNVQGATDIMWHYHSRGGQVHSMRRCTWAILWSLKHLWAQRTPIRRQSVCILWSVCRQKPVIDRSTMLDISQAATHLSNCRKSKCLNFNRAESNRVDQVWISLVLVHSKPLVLVSLWMTFLPSSWI